DAGQRLRPEHNGAVSLSDTGAGVSITNTVFEDNAQADVFVDCGSTPTLADNTLSGAGVVNEGGCP
ncbi:MAG: hypothetical protein R3266_14875, partial [Gemmatimonadota bacterium]|nr:hypothetical protein [Gemmatimonadota bacterium]